MTSKYGFSVVAPMSVIVPSSTCGSSASCCALLKRWISSMNSTVERPPRSIHSRARAMTARTSATPLMTARQRRERRVDRLREQPRERRLADARRAPQHHRREMAALDHPPQRAARRRGAPARRTPRASRGRIRAASGACAASLAAGQPTDRPCARRDFGLASCSLGVAPTGVRDHQGTGYIGATPTPTPRAPEIGAPLPETTCASPARPPCPTRSARPASRQMVNHRGPEFKALLDRLTPRPAARVRHRERRAASSTASGTGGLEAAVVNFLSPGDRVLAVSIGVFGDRFAKIATTYGADVSKIDVEWGGAADPAPCATTLEAMAAAGQPAEGRAPDAQRDLDRRHQPARGAGRGGALGRARHLILVDGISGLGAIPFETDALGPRRRRDRLPEGLDGPARPGDGRRLATRLGSRTNGRRCRASTSTCARTARAAARARHRGRRPSASASVSTSPSAALEAEGWEAVYAAASRLRRRARGPVSPRSASSCWPIRRTPRTP